MIVYIRNVFIFYFQFLCFSFVILSLFLIVCVSVCESFLFMFILVVCFFRFGFICFIASISFFIPFTVACTLTAIRNAIPMQPSIPSHIYSRFWRLCICVLCEPSGERARFSKRMYESIGDCTLYHC